MWKGCITKHSFLPNCTIHFNLITMTMKNNKTKTMVNLSMCTTQWIHLWYWLLYDWYPKAILIQNNTCAQTWGIFHWVVEPLFGFNGLWNQKFPSPLCAFIILFTVEVVYNMCHTDITDTTYTMAGTDGFRTFCNTQIKTYCTSTTHLISIPFHRF